MIGIKVKNFGISFGNMEILKNVSFNVEAGEIVTILGPSGSGKSTILRSIASLQEKFEGEILLNETCLLSNRTQCNKDIGYIFQDYALFPHLDVKDNIGFALFNYTAIEKERRIDELLKQFDLVEHRNKQIHELSGGQQQRVSIARTIAYNPKILLLDEPFSNLDSILRDKTKLWLKDIIKTLGLSAILVTHDKKEALSVSDKIGILQNKTLVQFGTPQELFKNPTNLYVAKFLGDINILPKNIAQQFGIDIQDNQTAFVRVQNTHITPQETSIKMHIHSVSYCGDFYEVTLQFANNKDYFIKTNIQTDCTFTEQKDIYLNLTKEDILIVNS